MTADLNAPSIGLEKLVKKGIDGLQDMLDMYADKNAYEGFPAMLRDGLAAIEALRAALDPDAVARMVQEAVNVSTDAEAHFSDWFRKNYPGPDTIIHKPDWHAPKIFRAAMAAIRARGEA